MNFRAINPPLPVGLPIAAMPQYGFMPQAAMYQPGMPVQRTDLTLGTAATPFGCCYFFDHCSDEIITLSYRGTLGLLDWMGFNTTDECVQTVEFINFVRPEYSQGSPTGGYLSDPCDDPNGVEFGSCSLTVDDFGRYGRVGPTRDIFKPMRYCKTYPRKRLDGQPVASEFEWDLLYTTDAIMNDIRVHLVTGNNTTSGQFDGLQRWVKTGYDCQMLDSYVVNWNGNDMDGGAGITINGAAIAATWNIVDVLLDIFRNIMERISWSPMLRNQPLQVGDVVLVLPGFLRRCLLDYYTCWSVCPGQQYEEVSKDSRDMREFRLTLNGGMFGFGQIALDGFTIPLLQWDWGLINGPTTGDMYLLTGQVGSLRVWEGQHLSAAAALDQFGVDPTIGGYFTAEGGRMLGKIDTDNTCKAAKLWMRPRLFCKAPWAQIRFQDIRCATPTGPLSPDPTETSFYPEGSFSVATC